MSLHTRSTTSVERPVDLREATILLAESRASTGSEIVEQLRADRYRAALARTTEHARALARAQPIRAIVLGVLETPRAGLDLLEEIRAVDGSVWDRRLPAIVLSAHNQQLDMLRAFEVGADDFMTLAGKAEPSYLELRARLRAVLRRIEERPGARLLRIGALEIDTGAHTVSVAGAPVELCRLEYELLVHLARDPSAVCSKHELLSAIWNQRPGAATRTVDSHASRLRRKLEAAGAGCLVVNVWGIGYRLI